MVDIYKITFFFYIVPVITAPLGDGTAVGETPSTCCACGNARYHIHFKGSWSRQTHSKHFPVKDGK
jgi:hypothetical protein